MLECQQFSRFSYPTGEAFHIFLGCQPPVPLPPGRSLTLPELNALSLEAVIRLDLACFARGLTIIVDDAAIPHHGSMLAALLKYLAFVYCKYFFLPLSSVTIPDFYGVREQSGQADPPLVLHRNMTALRNLPLHLHSPLADALSRYVRGHAALIVLPGPSLRDGGAFLREAAHRAIVICVARTLGFCLANGVTPDFVVNLDTDWRITRLLDGPPLPHTWFVSLSNANIAPVSSRFRGVFFMESFNMGILHKKYRMRESWLSVSVCCMGLAEALCASHIVMLGADGCWASVQNQRYFNATGQDALSAAARQQGGASIEMLPHSGPPSSAEGARFSVLTADGSMAETCFLYYAASGELEDVARQIANTGAHCWQWGGKGILHPAFFTPLPDDALPADWPALDRKALEEKLDAAHVNPLPLDVTALNTHLQETGKMIEFCLATVLMQIQHNENLDNHPVVQSMRQLASQQRFPYLPTKEAVHRAAVGTCMDWLRLQRRALAFARLHLCRKKGIAVRLLYREPSLEPLLLALQEAWPGLNVTPLCLKVFMLDAVASGECAQELYSGVLHDAPPVLLSPDALREAGDVPSLLGVESWLSVKEVLQYGSKPQGAYAMLQIAEEVNREFS